MPRIRMVKMMCMIYVWIIFCPGMMMVVMNIMIMMIKIMMMPEKTVVVMIKTVPMQLMNMVGSRSKAVKHLPHSAYLHAHRIGCSKIILREDFVCR